MQCFPEHAACESMPIAASSFGTTAHAMVALTSLQLEAENVNLDLRNEPPDTIRRSLQPVPENEDALVAPLPPEITFDSPTGD